MTPISQNSSTGSSASGAAKSNPSLNLTPTDFLNMMVKQLENQDPLNPTKSSDLLAQMSQIGQLQSTTSLQTSLSNFGLQTSISSASSMIGKTVQGLDSNAKPQTGVVTSVQVQAGNVALSLDNGQILPLANITEVAPGPSGTVAGTH